jgi:hypothetical protein
MMLYVGVSRKEGSLKIEDDGSSLVFSLVMILASLSITLI